MKRSTNFKKGLLLITLLLSVSVLLVGCGEIKTDNFNQFVPPAADVIEGGSEIEYVKTPLSGETAIKLLVDSFINAQAAAPSDTRYMNFSFSPYFEVLKNGTTKKYTIRIQGTIDSVDNNNSVFTFELISNKSDREEIVILGIYGKDGDVFIDSRNYETGGLVHQYYVDDMDLAFVSKYLKMVTEQLDLAGFAKSFSVGDLLDKMNLDPTIKNLINNYLTINGNLIDLVFSLISDTGSYVIDKGNGEIELIMPTKISEILKSGVLSTIISGALADKEPLVQGIVDLLFGDILSGAKTLDIYICASIKNNMFQKAAVSFDTKKKNTISNYELGIGELALSKSPDFKENIIKDMPNVVKAGRANYSFTTLSADLEIGVDLAKHTYSLGTIDTAIGGAIAGLLGTIDGEVWEETPIDISERTVIRLHLKLRAEIDLKNNDNTRIMLELRGAENDVLRLGLYYKGGRDGRGNDTSALYFDLSGMGGGRTKVSTYDKFVVDENGDYVMLEDGSYTKSFVYTGQKRYSKVTAPLNLNDIIVDALEKYIPEIPSVIDIVNGIIDGMGASDEENTNISSIMNALTSGEAVVPHFGFVAYDNSASHEEEESGGSIDVLGLITGILGCATIVKGDTTLSIKSLGIYLTQDIIDTIFKDALGLNLPVTRVDVDIYQTQDEGWKLDVGLELSKEEERLLTAEVSLYLNYGNPDPDFVNDFDKYFDKYLKNVPDIHMFDKDDTGALDNINIGAALEVRTKFHVADESVFDFSPIGKLLYGLVLQLKAEDEIDIDLALKIQANLNVGTLIGLINGEKGIGEFLNTLEARIDIISHPDTNDKSAMILYIKKGILYLEASALGLPKYKLDINEFINGNFKLFGKETGIGAALATEGNAAYQPDNTEEEPDLVAFLVGAIAGVEINNSYLEVKIADTLISALLKMVGLDFGEKGDPTYISNEGTAIKIEYDGLNLSKLWLNVNIGLQQDEANLDLGLGLGHIALTIGGWDNMSGNMNLDEYKDLLNGANIFLGADIEIDIFLKENKISLDNMLGALLADAQAYLGTEIDVIDTIDGGLKLSIVADLDISSAPGYNDTRLMVELRKLSTNGIILGLYYDALTNTLYLDSAGKVIRQVAIENLDLISLIKDKIAPGTSSALATADLDLSGMNPVIILSDRGIQIEVLQGISDLLIGLLAGDFKDHIDFEGSWKYHEDNGTLDEAILNAAEKSTENNELLYFQRDVERFVYVDDQFVAYDSALHAGIVNFYAEFPEGIYEKIDGLTPERLEQAVSTDDNSTYKQYALNGGFVEITAENEHQYADVVKYAKFFYAPIEQLGADGVSATGYGKCGWVEKYSDAGLPVFVRTQATEKDLCLYTIYSGGSYIFNAGTENEKEVSLNLPEIGAKIAIGRIEKGYLHGGDNDTEFKGIGIGVQFSPKATVDNPEPDPSASLAIKIGNIQLNDSKFKAASKFYTGLDSEVDIKGYFDFIDNKFVENNVPRVESISDLTVHLNLELSIGLGAYSTNDPEIESEWAIGSLIAAFAGNNGEESALMNFLKTLLLQFDVQDAFDNAIGLRIAGNFKIGRLLAEGELTDNLIAMIIESDLAVEIFNTYAWEANETNRVIGIYLSKGWLYINLCGDVLTNTRFKIQLSQVLDLFGEIGVSAAATADEEGGIADTLKLICGIIGKVTITNDSVRIGLGAQVLGTVIGLLANVEGVELPQLNEDNSFVEFDTDPETPGFLTVGLGIDPVYLTVGLSGLKVGLYPDENVIPEEVFDYEELEDFVIDVNMNLDIGVLFLEQDESSPAKYVACEPTYGGEKFVNTGTAENPVWVEYDSVTHAGAQTYKILRGFDLGAFIDNLGLLTDVSLAGLLNIYIPDGGVEVKLSLSISLAVNMTKIDDTVAEIRVFGQIISMAGLNNPDYEKKLLAAIYFKEGNLLVDLSGLGFGQCKITNLVLSNILGNSSGFQAIIDLLKKDDTSGSGSAMCADANATSLVDNDGVTVILTSEKLAVAIGKTFLGTLLDILLETADPSIKQILGSLDLEALVEINVSPLEINVIAEVADLLGVSISINNIKIGSTHEKDNSGDFVYVDNYFVPYNVDNISHSELQRYSDVIQRVGRIDGTAWPEALRLNFSPNAETGKMDVDAEITLETLALSLDLDLTALFSDGMFVGDKVIVGTIADYLMGAKIRINAEVQVGGLIETVNNINNGVIDKNDTKALLANILPLLKAQISIYKASSNKELISIYLYDNDIFLNLNGLGMPNLRITNEFLMNIINAATGSSTALATEDPAPAEESGGLDVIGLLSKLLDGIYLSEKALKIALTNDYFVTLLDTILFPDLEGGYYTPIMPENPDPQFSGIKLNLGNLVGENREGLLQVDLDAYSTHVNVDLMMPVLMFNTSIVNLPNEAYDYTKAHEITGASLALAGQLKINKQDGVALANILGDIVGDLPTTLVIEDDIDIRFTIAASIEFNYDLESNYFGIDSIDLKVALGRYYSDTQTTVALMNIYYSSVDGVLYVDLSHFFQNQVGADTKKLGKLKVEGIDLLSLLNGLLGGTASTSALASAGNTESWADDEHTTIYVAATEENTKAPTNYVKEDVLDENDNQQFSYTYFTIGSQDHIYVNNSDTNIENWEVYNSENPMHVGRVAHSKNKDTSGEYTLYVKDDVLGFIPYVPSDSEFKYKAKYLRNVIQKYVEYDAENALHNDKEKYVKVYDPTVCKNIYYSYSEYSELFAAPTRYNYSNGNYVVAADGDYVKSSIYGLSAVWADVQDPENLMVNITGKAMLGLIGAFVNNAAITDIIDNMLISIHVESNPFLFGIDIDLLDPYNNYESAFGLTLNIFGFDGAGSNLTFEYQSLAPDNKSEFRDFVNIDLDRLLGASNALDVLGESLNFGENNKVYLNASIDFMALAEATAGPKDWAPLLAGILGLSAEDIKVLLDVDFDNDPSSANETIDKTIMSIDISAAVDMKLITGLINGSGLDLEGTEIQIRLNLSSPVMAPAINDGAGIIITLIGKADGLATVYLDLSGYRNKGKHQMTINLGSLLGGALATSVSAYATADDVNRGILGDLLGNTAYDVIASLLGEIRLGAGKLTIGLNDSFIANLLNKLAGLNIDPETAKFISGNIYLDIRNLSLGINLYLGEINEGVSDIYAGLSIGKINLAKPDNYIIEENSFIPSSEQSGFKDILDLTLDIEFKAEIQYDGSESEPDGGYSIDKIFDLIGSIAGLELFNNPNFRIKIAGGGVNAFYTLKAGIHLDLGDFNNMKIGLEIWRQEDDEGGNLTEPEMRLGVYVDGSDIYVDLSGLGLPKLAIRNINLGDMLNNLIGGALDGISVENNEAIACSTVYDVTKWGSQILSGDEQPYLTAIFRNNGVALGLNGKLLNAVLELIGGLLNKNIQLPDMGDLAVIFDSAVTGDNTNGVPMVNLIWKINDRFALSIRGTELHIDGNRTSVPEWDYTADKLLNKVYSVNSDADPKNNYVDVYDIESGKIGLERVDLGFDIQIRQNGHNSVDANHDGICDCGCEQPYADGFENYLKTLIRTLLKNNDLGFDFNIFNGQLGYDVKLRASLNLGELILALSGSAVNSEKWWKDIELYLTINPDGYGTLLKVYKQAGSGDLYLDLSGLSLFKVKVVGLGGLLAGIASSTSGAMATEDGSVAASDSANFTLLLGQTGIQLDIGWGVVEGILQLLGDSVAIGYDEASGYKTITIGTLTIPLPKLHSEKALSVGLVYASAAREISLGLSIGIGLDNLGNDINLAIDNFVLRAGTDSVLGINENGYVNSGATNGIVNDGTNHAKENIFNEISGANANSFSGLVLNDAYGLNLLNILKGVIGGIDMNISINWDKQITHYTKEGTGGTNNKLTEPTNTTITLTRTTSSSKDSGNDKVYAGKFQAHINCMTYDRQITAWLFNNAVYLDLGDLTGLLSGISSFHQYKVADLNLIDLIGGLTASDDNSGAALATADGETGETSTIDIGSFIKGIEINWWYNNSVIGKTLGDKDISTIRINLNAQGINDLLVNLYYMLYTLYNPDAVPTKDDFGLLPYDVRYKIVATTENVTHEGVTYKGVDAYKHCVYYLQSFAAELLGNMVMDLLGSMLAPGALAGGILQGVLSCLLPLPLLDNNKSSFVEIVLDKSKINSTGIISEIGIYLNKEKSRLNGSNTFEKVGFSESTAAITITLNQALELRAVQSVAQYDENNLAPDTVGKVINVADPFDPVELSAASLAANDNLVQKVDATFYGITEYTSKSEVGQSGNESAILGGTHVVWDTSTVSLIPGATSVMTGYALNYPVQTVTVTVSSMAQYSKLYGYVNANGQFVPSNHIVVDPTKDPELEDATTVAELPNIIVIMRKDGELQVLDTEYDNGTPTTIMISGVSYTANGKFGWIEPTKSEIVEGGNVTVDFWYQVGRSSRIKVSTKIVYQNSVVDSGILPEGAKFDILHNGSAKYFDANNIDIKGNFGLPDIGAASITVNSDNTFTYKDSDGSEYVFIPDSVEGLTAEELAEWGKHVIGLTGTFTRSFKNTVLHSGTYLYLPANESSTETEEDKGVYTLNATSGNTGVKELQVVLANGLVSSVGVVGWKYDLDYSMNKPEEGVKGTITAILNKYESELVLGTTKYKTVNSMQEIKMSVFTSRYKLDNLSGKDGKSAYQAFNQYDDMFVVAEGLNGQYAKVTNDVFVKYDANNKDHTDLMQYVSDNGTYVMLTSENAEQYANVETYPRYVIISVTGYVRYNSALYPDVTATYDINIFDTEIISVRVKNSKISTITDMFNAKEFIYYTNRFDVADGSKCDMFIVPQLKFNTDMQLRVYAVYDNGTYSQEFGFKVLITPKVATKAVILVEKGTEIISVSTATVYFNDGTSMSNVTIENLDLTTVPVDSATGIVNQGGTFFTTANIIKTAEDTISENFAQNSISVEIRVY